MPEEAQWQSVGFVPFEVMSKMKPGVNFATIELAQDANKVCSRAIIYVRDATSEDDEGAQHDGRIYRVCFNECAHKVSMPTMNRPPLQSYLFLLRGGNSKKTSKTLPL